MDDYNTMEGLITKLTGSWMTGSEQGTVSPVAFMEALEILGRLQTSVRSRHSELEEFVAAPTPDKATVLLASIEEARKEGRTRMARLEELGPPI
ncbi:MAG: hypothetical protein Greene041639_211 [Parcubacteria group bacterium Greene0416_39]|nr:MAG: hypothetical protein Greene041639_211 [Parcubacteria group bacterium Greene0416_39]